MYNTNKKLLTSVRIRLSLPIIMLYIFLSCSDTHSVYLSEALELAGDNRAELEKVLDHYKEDPEKLAAAEFLIENMSGHYSYSSDDIHEYYATALGILASGMTPEQQRDTLLLISKRDYPYLYDDSICDLEIVKADFLIKNIDQAFDEWRGRPWARHLTFDEFCEWLLPYKVAERQELDCWRDTLSTFFTWGLNNMVRDDDTYETTINAVNTIRNEINWRVRPHGLWDDHGYPMLSAATMPHITYGTCRDYVTLAVATYRSVGIPCVIDETPYWGRYRAGHSWYTILNNRGEELTSEWDVSSMPGTAFFTDKRIPKVYRNTYAINRERQEYARTSAYKHPFSICQKDVTDQYFRTSDLEIQVFDSIKLAEPYVYIATFTGIGSDWSVVDVGTLSKGKACFSKMGRNVMYITLGYDGEDLQPLSLPFILHTDGTLQYIRCSHDSVRSVDVRRKYYQSNNVAKMRKRILHGKIQCATRRDFSDSTTVYTIDNLYIPDKIMLESAAPHRYWRYLSPDGSNGSIAELAFFDDNDSLLTGQPIGSTDDANTVARAFDNDWLSNFETWEANGNWVGMDMQKPVKVAKVRVVPRSDDNDIHPGDMYELRYWSQQNKWVSCGTQVAESNSLHYDNIPVGALIWVSDLTRGMDERPFLIDESENVEWW